MKYSWFSNEIARYLLQMEAQVSMVQDQSWIKEKTKQILLKIIGSQVATYCRFFLIGI